MAERLPSIPPPRALPPPRAIPSPRTISASRDSLIERVGWSLYDFLAIFALPFAWTESDGYPLEEFLPVVISRDESSSQSYHNSNPPISVTGGKGEKSSYLKCG